MNYEETVMHAILARRSVRSYVPDKPVEKEKLRRLLEAGMAAPSACNLQPWEFIVVTDEDKMAKLRPMMGFGNYNAPAAIVMLGNTSGIPWGGEDWKIDVSAAVENMMIMAAAMGLGSVWLGSYDEKALRELLDIPENIRVMNVAYFGYPAKTPNPKTRYNEEAVFYEKYDPARQRKVRTIDMLGDSDTSD